MDMDMEMEHTDLLLDILRRLPPRSLAVSRCVCSAWRATIDRHRLLRTDLLPLSLDGAIYDELQMDPPQLFGRRSTTRYVTTNLDYLADDPDYADYVQDYCNGLLLVQSEKDMARVKMVNPATRQWAPLPRLPCACSWPAGSCGRCRNNCYLVYDPTVSPHYEVFFVPRVPADTACSAAEWPPSPYVMHVFSSMTNRWEDKSFVRQGDAAGTIQDVISCRDSDRGMYYTAYWQGSLYVPSRHIKHDFLLRINLSSDKYQVIKLPKGGDRSRFRLGKSKKGVYYVLHTNVACTFQVWFLHESCGLIDWVLKNEINLKPAFSKDWHHGPWIPQSRDQIELLKNDANLNLVDEYNKALAEDDFDWDSDDENVVSITDWPKKCNADTGVLYCLGFHPYKEIVLFHERWLCHCSAIAYHLNSSKVRYLGHMGPQCRYSTEEISFAYSPCWMMDLPGSN